MTFSHELAQARLDWRHSYIMTSCAHIYTPISLHLKSISLHLKSITSCTLLALLPPSSPPTEGDQTVPILLLINIPDQFVKHLS